MSHSPIPRDRNGTEIRQLGIRQFDKLTTPHLDIKDNTLADNNLVLGCPLDDGHASKAPQQDLGSLDVLALELLQDVLVQLDLSTLTGFRRVNRRGLQVVDSIPQYKAITTHAPNTLRGALSIETGRFITCEALYNTFCTAECETCGDFGGYVYLLTCKRACFLCLSEDLAYFPLPHDPAANKSFDTVPHMRSIPGIYSPDGCICRKRLHLIDVDSAHQAGVEVHCATSSIGHYLSYPAARRLEEHPMRVLLAAIAELEATIRQPPTFSDPFRFMAIIQTPVFNNRTQEVDYGSYCLGCKRSHHERPQHWRRRFTRDSFGAHLYECGPIRDGKHRVNEILTD